MDNPEINIPEADTEMNTNPRYKPITCPKCGSREIAFVTEYHKCLGLRIAQLILIPLIALSVLIYVADMPDPNIMLLMIPIFLLIVFVIISIYIIVYESKTHVQAICRDCGKLWILN